MIESGTDVQTINQLLTLTAIMLIFVVGLLVNYLFDLVCKSIESSPSLFFCKFGPGATPVAATKVGSAVPVSVDQHNKDIGAAGDAANVSSTVNNTNTNGEIKVDVESGESLSMTVRSSNESEMLPFLNFLFTSPNNQQTPH